MTKVIAIAQAKGGVGKTTTALNLGVGLARQGKKVLLIDFDQQGDLTKCLGVGNPNELKNTISMALNHIIEDEEFNPKSCIQHHEENVDFIPANGELAAVEVALVNSMTRECVMREYINMIKHDYEYVLIDCRPSLGLTVINALTAADSVIVPVQAHILAAGDMESLFKTIGRIKRQLNPRLKVDGIVMTMVDNRTNLAKNTIRNVREQYGSAARIFKTEIPFAIKAAEIPSSGQSIYTYDANSKVALAYENLTKEVTEIGSRQKQKDCYAR